MPTRNEIHAQVVRVLAGVANQPETAVSEGALIERDLGLTSTVRRALALSYTRIASRYASTGYVSMDEAEELRTVEECVDLVTARANGPRV